MHAHVLNFGRALWRALAWTDAGTCAPQLCCCTSKQERTPAVLHLLGRQVTSGARDTDRDRERLGERTSSERGEGGIGGRKRNDLCKANVGLSQLWEITGKRLIMPTSTLLFSKTREQPSPTPHSFYQSCYPALLPCSSLLSILEPCLSSPLLSIGHTHS